MTKKLIKTLGNPVLGEAFWNREQEVSELIELLDEGTHLLIVAPRRIGKTSLMHQVRQKIEERYYCLFVDLQDCRSSEAAIVEFSKATRKYRSLWSRTLDVFQNVLGNVDELKIDEIEIRLGDGISGAWQAKAKRLLAELATAEQSVVFFIDELPIMLNSMLQNRNGTFSSDGRSQVEHFVSWLRYAAQQYVGKFRFVVSGSIGLLPVLQRAKLSATINEFHPFRLGVWSDKTAVGCLEALANNYDIEFMEGASQRIVQCLGWCVPHHVQLFFHELYTDARFRNDFKCSAEDIERVYKEQMLGQYHPSLNHWEERLEFVLGASRSTLGFELLSEAAVTGKITKESAWSLAKRHFPGKAECRSALREILDVFLQDGYLRREKTAEYVFVSNYIRDWWSQRNRDFYIPIERREE
jgi:hypothetical protein